MEFSRTELLIGTQSLQTLKQSHVAIFGVGGVGGYVAEALVRSGIEHFDLIDADVVSISNINRQIIALHSTIGKNKVDVMKERMLDINPNVQVQTHSVFVTNENIADFNWDQYNYVVDAIDTISAKIALVLICQEKNIPILSSMGAGNKMDPTKFEVTDIYKTKICPLAKVMRRELKKRRVKHLKVVYSQELPVKIENQPIDHVSHKAIPGSSSFVPSAAGLIIASQVVKDLIK
ncbi:MAG: ThiF family adenylyltransferase [Floccifex sp.]